MENKVSCCLITRARVRASPSLPSQREEVTGEIMAVISHSSPGRPCYKPRQSHYWDLLLQTMLFRHKSAFVFVLWLLLVTLKHCRIFSSSVILVFNEWDIQNWWFWYNSVNSQVRWGSTFPSLDEIATEMYCILLDKSCSIPCLFEIKQWLINVSTCFNSIRNRQE